MRKAYSTKGIDCDNDYPYPEKIPDLRMPKGDLSAPRTRRQKLYCWFFWLKLIQRDPRYVLDNLESIPTFRSNWCDYEHRKVAKRRVKSVTTTK